MYIKYMLQNPSSTFPLVIILKNFDGGQNIPEKVNNLNEILY